MMHQRLLLQVQRIACLGPSRRTPTTTQVRTKCRTLLLVASASVSIATTNSKRTAFCASNNRRRRPVTFGASIRSYFDTIDLQDRDHCPICEKYSQGPCGTLFQTWLKCTDDHPGKDTTGQQDLHLSKCANQAQALAQCLEQNEAYYETPFEEDNSDDTEELQQAWERLIREDLTDVQRLAFPKEYQPILEFRPKDRLAVTFLDLQEIKHQSLLLVFVQDKESGVLLSAGSLDDLFVFSRKGKDVGVLQCTLPERTDQIEVSALYEPKDTTGPSQVIYTYTAKVPKG